MKKIVPIVIICFSSLCFADFDTLIVLPAGDDDGALSSRLIEGSDGSLYGTNELGGDFGAGTIFKINKDGSNFQILHTFAADPNDGIRPLDHVIEGSDGALYGTTPAGGKNGLGTIFKINKDGTGYLKLFDFSEENIGFFPTTTLLEGSDGLLYGTTSTCGAHLNRCSFTGLIGSPSIFRISKDGTGFSNLLFLQGITDETESFGLGNVSSSLIEGSDGYLYGSGGSLFKVEKDGNNVKLLVDSSKSGIDSRIDSINIISNNGFIYGIGGGLNNVGGIFKIDENGNNFQTLRNFVNSSNTPSFPKNGLELDVEKGILYGVANSLAYKLNTDGAEFEIISVTQTDLYGILSSPSAPLLASDGALYGVLRHASCNHDIFPGIYSLKNSVETIFDWAESQYPQYFPTKESTQVSGPWSFRHYPTTNIYLGINKNDNGVYVLGGVFGNSPLFVNSKKPILTQAIGVNAILCEN